MTSVQPLVTTSPLDISATVLRSARSLRDNQASAEQILWECLQASRLCQVQFRHRHNIGRFVLEFYCPSAGLVVELHSEETEPSPGERMMRDLWLAERGLKLVCVKPEEVFQDLEGVLRQISQPVIASIGNSSEVDRCGNHP